MITAHKVLNTIVILLEQDLQLRYEIYLANSNSINIL